MTDEAGPSGSGTGKVDPAVLAEADAKYEQGVQCLRSNDLDAAVQLFAEVLQVRAQHYGELAPECAAAYYRYGAALLYQAQDSGDVFGASVKEAAAGDDEEEGGPEEADDKENGGGKGKAPAAAGASASSSGGDEEEEEEGEDAGEAAENDLQLAWENLETAKVIWAREADKNTQQLADVHGLLGDVAMESDDFATALAELDASLAYLHKFVQEDDRRIAEVQYKRCCALQFSGEVEAALPAVQAACQCLEKRREVVAAKLASPGEGDDVDKLKAEGKDVAAVLEDLKEKVQELQDLIAQNADTKNMLKGAFAQLAAVGASGGSEQQAAAAAPAAPATAAAGEGGSSGGFDAASGGAAAGGGAVKNLGVVGRGTKRINLQPVQTNVPAPSAAAAAAEPAAKKKRSLEDLMGGGDAGETTIGFGSAPTAAAAAAPSEAATAPAAAETTAAPAVPAFLQAASVQAVYGNGSGAGEQEQ